MMKIVFTPRLNLFDACLVSLASYSISDGHWLVAAGVCFIGGAISAFAERLIR